MFHVDINIDPQRIGLGELASVISAALDKHFSTKEWTNPGEASFRTSVTYTNPFKKAEGDTSR